MVPYPFVCRMGPRLGALLVLATAAVTVGCSPELNWREVRPEAADGLTALFPCKPSRTERQVPWPGAASGVTMRLLSCQTGGSTWALSYMTVPEVGMLVPSMHEFTMTMRRNLGAASQMAGNGPAVAEEDLGPVAVPGMTPMSQAHGWRFHAQRPDGLRRPLDLAVTTWHFSHGMTVFQASVWQQDQPVRLQSGEDVADAFFHGLHFPA